MNIAYIDSQNIYLGIKDLGWELDYRKFRIYLREKYKAKIAYIFIGYIQENQNLYSNLQKYGYILKFKPVLPDKNGKPKGNVDADLVLQAMVDYYENNFEKAVIISSDGDFYCLVKFLYQNNSLEKLISPYRQACSVLLKKTAKEKIVFMTNSKEKFALKRKSTA